MGYQMKQRWINYAKLKSSMGADNFLTGGVQMDGLSEDVKIIQKAYDDHEALKKAEIEGEEGDPDTVTFTKAELTDLIKAEVGAALKPDSDDDDDDDDDYDDDDDDDDDESPVEKSFQAIEEPVGTVFECGHCGKHNELPADGDSGVILKSQNEKMGNIAKELRRMNKALGLVGTLIKGQKVTLVRLDALEKAMLGEAPATIKGEQTQPMNKGMIASVTGPASTMSSTDVEKLGNLEFGDIEKIIAKAVTDEVLDVSDEAFANTCLGTEDIQGLFTNEKIKEVLLKAASGQEG